MSEEGAWPDGPLVRWARIVNGVVAESPVLYTADPNVFFANVEIPQTFVLCPDEQVECHWLYDEATNTFTEPPLLPEREDPSSTANIMSELKSNPELLAELRKLLME